MRKPYTILGLSAAMVAMAAAVAAADGDRAAEAGRPGASEASRPLVVIDPGHGGTNKGAPGTVPGLYEKQVTLELARALRKRLHDRGYRVALTRDRDVYLTLRQRVRYANRVGADLFISLHANASASHGHRGYETFILPPEALDVDGRALRLEDGTPRPGLDRDTAMLLDDLERGGAQGAAAALAVAIQGQLRAVRGAEGDRGVRQGAMHVLLGATMPAVLVEMGFIDHPVEGRELADPAMREQIAEALTAAVISVLPAGKAAGDKVAAVDASGRTRATIGSAHGSP